MSDVEGVVVVDAARPRRLLHLAQEFTKLLDLFRRDALRGEAPDQGIEPGPDFIQFVGLRERKLPDEDAAVLFHPHQAGLLEGAQRLAHGPSRNLEVVCHVGFVELRA
ncbi:MAG TPA: hypothetical protein VNO51_18400, partial [Ilumatobacteraceae bacterium]|nr:hypothetical protein [Ilumatobacteraceae bacterium]